MGELLGIQNQESHVEVHGQIESMSEGGFDQCLRQKPEENIKATRLNKVQKR
jgi:hypothetical protein